MGAEEPDGRGAVRTATPVGYMGLLDHITAHSLDEDYAAASRGRGPRRRAPGRWAMAALAAFGLLVTVAAEQSAREEPVRQETQASLVSQVNAARAELDATVEELTEMRAEVEAAQESALLASSEGRALESRLTQLRLVTGEGPAQGPGLRIVVDDNPEAESDSELVLDRDLQALVNGLWTAGAEAVSINGQRLSSLSAIRYAGRAITVNFRSLSRPYVVSAIGDPDTLAARFIESRGGSQWLDISEVYGLQFDMSSEELVTVPAVNQLALRHAQVPRDAR